MYDRDMDYADRLKRLLAPDVLKRLMGLEGRACSGANASCMKRTKLMFWFRMSVVMAFL